MNGVVKKGFPYLVILAALCFAGCQPVSYQKEMQELLDDSQRCRQIRKDGYVIRIQHLPTRYFELRHLMALPDSSTDLERTKATDEAKNMYDGSIYFMMTLSLEDEEKDILNRKIADFAAWSAELQKFHFRLGEYVYLTTDNVPEVKLSVYDFQNTFGYTKNRKMLLCFPRTFNERDILDDGMVSMVIKDWGWDIGKQTVRWDASDLK